MKRMLKKIENEKLCHFVNGERRNGQNEKMSGNCSDLRGDCSELSGDCTDLCGNCSGLCGDLDVCEIIEEERKAGIDIKKLINTGAA